MTEESGAHEQGNPLRSFGDRMRYQRTRQELTQTDLAKLAGVDLAWINRLESGERQNISLAVARRIARALRVSLDYLADTFGELEGMAAGVDMLECLPTPAVVAPA